MTLLIPRSPADGLTPIDEGGTTLIELPFAPVTSIAPFDADAVARALKPLKLAFPKPGRSQAKGDARILWSGHDQAFLIGAEAPEIAGAAVTDQSDAWAILRLQGPLAEPALARLVPLDLRDAAFPVDATARTLLFHMMLSITRTGADAFDLMVFRSMAATAVHEIAVALRSVATQTH